MLPLRPLLPELGATEKPTEPLPVPLDPKVILIQLALLLAVQAQEELVVTLTVPVWPADAADNVPGLMAKEQLVVPFG